MRPLAEVVARQGARYAPGKAFVLSLSQTDLEALVTAHGGEKYRAQQGGDILDVGLLLVVCTWCRRCTDNDCGLFLVMDCWV
jgi:hypothetical protein